MKDLGTFLEKQKEDLHESTRRDFRWVLFFTVVFAGFMYVLIHLLIISVNWFVRFLIILGIVSTGIVTIFGIVLCIWSRKWYREDLERLDAIERRENHFVDPVASLRHYNVSVAISTLASGMLRPQIYMGDSSFVCTGVEGFYSTFSIWEKLLQYGYIDEPLTVKDTTAAQYYGIRCETDRLVVYFVDPTAGNIYQANYPIGTDGVVERIHTFTVHPGDYCKIKIPVPVNGLTHRELFAFVGQS